MSILLNKPIYCLKSSKESDDLYYYFSNSRKEVSANTYGTPFFRVSIDVVHDDCDENTVLLPNQYFAIKENEQILDDLILPDIESVSLVFTNWSTYISEIPENLIVVAIKEIKQF